MHVHGVVREVNVRVLEKWLELLSANGGRFDLNQLLFANDAELVVDSEEKLFFPSLAVRASPPP